MDPIEQAIAQAIEYRLRDLWTALPCTVLAFNVSKATADLQPLPTVYLQGVAQTMPPLRDVRVCYPGSVGNQCALAWQLAAGDPVLAVFSALPAQEGDPESPRHHDLADGFCVPLAWRGATPAIPPTADEIRIAGQKVWLGSGPRLPVVRDGDATQTPLPVQMAVWISQVTAALNALVPGSVTAVPETLWDGSVSASSTVVEAS